MINKYFKYIVAFSAIAVSCYGIEAKQARSKQSGMEAKGFAVIELFTSEGCSSCPAADKLVGEVLNENNEDVYILSYHVDYWNRLGWKDEFSKALFSDRQKQYARSLSLQGIYTPQIVVNGTEEFVGSDEPRLRESLSKNRQTNSGLSVAVEKMSPDRLKLTYSNVGDAAEQLNIALIQSTATTDVKDGENRGRKLNHVNIVRDLKTVKTAGIAGTVDIPISKELQAISLKIVAFTQRENDRKITGITQFSL